MSARGRIQGVGPGQTNRIDQNGDAHQNAISPGKKLEVPKNSISGTKTRGRKELPNDWRTMELAQHKSGEVWNKGPTNWQKFASGNGNQGPNKGSVVIGGETSNVLLEKGDKLPKNLKPADLAQYYHQRAAQLEEWARDTREPRGGKQYTRVPESDEEVTGTEPVVPKVKAGKQRRSFKVLS